MTTGRRSDALRPGMADAAGTRSLRAAPLRVAVATGIGSVAARAFAAVRRGAGVPRLRWEAPWAMLGVRR